MSPSSDPKQNGALRPIEGFLSEYMEKMTELNSENMPDVVMHEYSPLLDSSDIGPPEWAVMVDDIKDNYLHFDGFVLLMGTDTMAYTATALSFMLENLGKPVIFTGSQIPINEPYNDARRNLIMALIFASRDSICEVSIFFHDRLIRANRATKINTHKLFAFDSPNLDPLATVGVCIKETKSLRMHHPRGALRAHTGMETRVLPLRMVPGFDGKIIQHVLGDKSNSVCALVLQLYEMGNLPSSKLLDVLSEASERGVLVVAATQCFRGSVMMGAYATGHALVEAGVVSANDMTLEAVVCKIGYLLGRGDLTREKVKNLIGISLRGELTPREGIGPLRPFFTEA